MLKIYGDQMNPTIGDIAGNVKMMISAAEAAHAQGDEMIVYPELSVTGYYPGDMLDEPGFGVAVNAGLEKLLLASASMPGLRMVVGLPTAAKGPGKPWFNTLMVLRDGREELRQHKQLLPTGGVFDERRHFRPGSRPSRVLLVEQDGQKPLRVGFAVCEDLWNDSGLDYDVNPYEQLQGCDLVISINASPSDVGKRETRHDLFSRASMNNGLPILWVNMVGGQDSLVFDGASFAVMPDKGVVFEAVSFEATSFRIEFSRERGFEGRGVTGRARPAMATPELYRRQLSLGLVDYMRRTGFKKVVVGCSGGADSALVITLAAFALGAENVLAITMPSSISSASSVSDSMSLCARLNVRLINHPIAGQVEASRLAFKISSGEDMDALTLGNLQARIRAEVLMAYSNKFGHLLLTTGNKSETSTGFFTIYGDAAGGLNILGDIYKTEVWELMRHLNTITGREIIPATIIDKAPSAELEPGQLDTDSLPPYPLLDAILRDLIEGSRLPVAERHEVDAVLAEIARRDDGQKMVQEVRRKLHVSEYKRRQAAPIIRVRSRAFGSGRQMPIACVHGY